MRFKSLRIENFKAIREFEVSELSDFVLIAGPNGSGKSCVFDGVRLLKSLYGGHQTDEHMQWFAEFAINPQDKSALRRIFRDPKVPMRVSGQIEFADSEVAFLNENAKDLVLPLAWELLTGQRMDHWSFNRMAVATQLAHRKAELDQISDQLVAQLTNELAASGEKVLAVSIFPDGSTEIAPCVSARVSFQSFEPEHLGIIEYHSASRAYPRQPLAGINLDPKEFENQRRQHMLYNWQNKYQNVKSELAAGYLRNLIRGKVGKPLIGEELDETLKELFRTFFPEKKYLGVQATDSGTIEFPVELQSGGIHDIDDLSSGEKEILYGYLRLRNSTPRNSVVLLDEPELHLNPSMLGGFAQFYYRHLGVAQDNQLWLVTHSDALLRQAIGSPQFGIFHMLNGETSTGNQASEVLLNDDLNRVLVELVGDLAAYQPHGKVLLLEGDGGGAFDAAFISSLFPDFARRVNLVPGGSKKRVRDLHDVLNEAAEAGGVPNRFFAIVDKDFESDQPERANEFVWDVYHVENYLLHPPSIRLAAESLLGREVFPSDDAVSSALKGAANELIDELVMLRLSREIDEGFVTSIRIARKSTSDSKLDDLIGSVEATSKRIAETSSDWDSDAISTRADEIRAELEAALEDETWMSLFPGREILRRFAGQSLDGVGYEPLRNVTLDKMALGGFRPAKVSEVLTSISEAV